MHVKSFAGLAPALLIGLVAAPAQAQQLTLQSGDNVTVGSAGTTGTYQGLPYNSPTASYVENTGNTIVVSTPANSAFTLNSGGSIQGNGGGDIGIDATNSAITINGGSITGPDALDAFGGTVNVTGGTISGNFGLYANDANTQISGGSFSGFTFPADIEGGTVDITGGTFTSTVGPGLRTAYRNALATISGGSFSSIESDSGSAIDLLGTFSQTAPITSGTGQITGTLLDGQAFSTNYNVSGGLIEFNANPVPETSTTASFGLMLALGLGGLAWGAWRRRARATRAFPR